MITAAPKPSSSKPNRMLSPAAYSEALLPSLRLSRSSRLARKIGKILLFLLVVGFAVVAVAPWQQSVTGSGNVFAFSPLERRQNIQIPIKGRIVRWGDEIYENAHVKEGDVIAEVQDMDPELKDRLKLQVDVAQAQVGAAEDLLRASQRNRDATNQFLESQKAQLRTYRSIKEQIVASAEAAIAEAKNKIQAELETQEGHEAAVAQTKADFDRQTTLYNEQIVSLDTLQLAQRKYLEAVAKVDTAKAYVESAKNNLTVKERDRNAKERKAQAEIDYATAGVNKAEGELYKAESIIAKDKVSLGKTRNDLVDKKIKLSRQENQVIRAPFDGYLTRINANQGSQILKEGDILCEIVPDTADRAVQILLDGNDAPLVSPGRHVRLQFEGWPAMQFAGWPSVAVGTFGGTVVSVDATDNGKGQFRILVQPDMETDQVWPDERYLRQGVQAHAWVLLEQVPLWYEIWRNMNGFPPVVTPDKSESKAKKPKLPKS